MGKGSTVNFPARSEVPIGEKLIAASITAMRGQKRPSLMEPLRQDFSKKMRVLSDTSTISGAAPLRMKLSLSKRSGELASKTLSMLHLEVQKATITFHKYWTDRWKAFVESSDLAGIFAIIVSQMGKAFAIAIKAEVLCKNLQKKNKEFFNKASQAEEVAKKAKVDAKATKKHQAGESLNRRPKCHHSFHWCLSPFSTCLAFRLFILLLLM